MDTERFDHLTKLTGSLSESRTRRGALRLLAAVAVGAGSRALFTQDQTAARGRRKKKNKNRNKNQGLVAAPSGTATGGTATGGATPNNAGGGGASLPQKGLREICVNGQHQCSQGLQCGAPTTRHTCASTVEGIDTWCCVPPGGRCSECDCCGDYYCSYDDNNVPVCIPNPEG